MSTATTTAPSPFTSKANNKEKGDYENPPVGSHPAVLIGLIDLGTHKSPFQNDKGDFPDVRQYLYVWELTAEHNRAGETFVIGQAFNSSFHKKSGGRQMLEGWTGRKFNDGEEFDPSSLIGRACVVNLIDENGYVKLAGVSNPTRGLTVPEATRPTLLFHLSQLNGQADLTPEMVPEWLPYVFGKRPIDEVQSSHEYQRLHPF